MNLFSFFNKVDKSKVYLSYDQHRKNFGDILSPIIANHYGIKKIKRISKRKCKFYDHYFMIGSILQRSTSHSIIWGSGFIAADVECSEIPKKVLAVRGPSTREKLLQAGIDCPEIYGDPALLMPEIYSGDHIKTEYKLGIIPHYLDKKDEALQKFRNHPEVNIIDIQNNNPLQVIDEMLKCEKIVSSSLHGIIVADAYNIPSVWVQFSIPLEGGDFKFQDYFRSVQRSVSGVLKFNDFKSLDDITKVFKPYQINIDLEKLRSSFPF